MQEFNLQRLNTSNKKQAREITAVCYIEEDKTYYYLFPDPCAAVYYRVRKDNVVKVSPFTQINCSTTGALKQLYQVCFYESSEILKCETGNAALSVELAKNAFELLTLNTQISFRANGEGTLSFNGRSYSCLGNNTIKYPTDLTIKPSDKYLRKWSTEFQVWMEYAVLIWGQRGIYIHLDADTIAGNGGEMSQGCIHLASPHAEEFYNWVTDNVRIQISYPW